jgi:hypothetical protein
MAVCRQNPLLPARLAHRTGVTGCAVAGSGLRGKTRNQ